MEHLFGIGYLESNEEFLEVDIEDHIPEIEWPNYYYYYYYYYYYDPSQSLGPKIPDDPVEHLIAILHTVALYLVPGYDNCRYDEYMCSDMKTCIPWGWQCDGWSDCSDGTDEMVCGGKC